MIIDSPIVSGSLLLTGSLTHVGDAAHTGSFNLSGSLSTTGTITATTLVVQTITSSISSITGSTKFGSGSINTHQFTGSVLISGSSTAFAINNNMLFVSSSGQVGIGTITPSTLLQVTTARTNGTDVNVLTLSDTTTGVQTVGFGARIQYLSNTTSVQAAIGLEQGGSGTNNESQISFYTQNTAGALTKQLTIGSTGASTFSSSVTATQFNISASGGTTQIYNTGGGHTVITNATANKDINYQVSGTGGHYFTNDATFNARVRAKGGSNLGGYYMDYQSDASSRSFRISSEHLVYGDFVIQKSTTRTGTTYENLLYFNASRAATFPGSITSTTSVTNSSTFIISSSSATTIASMSSGLISIRDQSYGGGCLVFYEYTQTPIILSQAGATVFTTGSPSAGQIQLAALGGGSGGISALGGSSRNGAQLSVGVFNNS